MSDDNFIFEMTLLVGGLVSSLALNVAIITQDSRASFTAPMRAPEVLVDPGIPKRCIDIIHIDAPKGVKAWCVQHDGYVVIEHKP